MSNLQHFAKTPATRIDSMEVYESPFQSRMSGELFQSGLRFDDYDKKQTKSGFYSASARRRVYETSSVLFSAEGRRVKRRLPNEKTTFHWKTVS